MFNRIRNSLLYRLKWANLGIIYFRQPDIQSVRIGARRILLSFPESERTIHEYEFGRIVFDDCYELASIAGPVRRVLDIGGNIGLFALAARRAFPDAEIHCYEPNPAVVSHLRSHCASVGAHVHVAAVGKTAGTVSLALSGNSLHTVLDSTTPGSVPLVSFEKVMEGLGEVDLLKLDCEGAEWEIFDCVAAWRGVRCLTMEYHLWAKPGSTVSTLCGVLSGLGFSEIQVRPSPNGPWGFAYARR